MQKGDADSWFVLAFCTRQFRHGSDMVMVALDKFFEESGIPEDIQEIIKAWYTHTLECRCKMCDNIARCLGRTYSQDKFSLIELEACNYIEIIGYLSSTVCYDDLCDACYTCITQKYILNNHPHLYDLADLTL